MRIGRDSLKIYLPFNQYSSLIVMAEETRDKDFIEQVVKMLVDNPDDVKVERKIDEILVGLGFH